VRVNFACGTIKRKVEEGQAYRSRLPFIERYWNFGAFRSEVKTIQHCHEVKNGMVIVLILESHVAPPRHLGAPLRTQIEAS